MNSASSSKNKDKPCFFYVDSESLTSYRDVLKKISSKDLLDKKDGLEQILGSIVNDENYPTDLMMQGICNLTIVDDINIKKRLFLFWEAIDKHNPDGKIKDEIILLCNSLRKDLDSSNEYVRGRTLRLLTKLPYPEIFENVKAAVFENIKHTHPYVRSNALLCIINFIENFGADIIPDSMPDQLKDIILKDNDTATRRNAYLVYGRIAPIDSLSLTQEIMENNEISELGDLFVLSIIENIKKLSEIFPQKISSFIKMLVDLSAHKSHSVLFEIGSLLLEISSNPGVVSKAVNILCSLLQEIKDNNTIIIILKKLYSLKNHNPEILQEHILTLANLINLDYTKELRNLSFQLIDILITRSTLPQIFDKFMCTYTQLNSVIETELTISLRNQILECMLKNIIKFPDVDEIYPLFILEKNLTFQKDKEYIQNQIIAVKELFLIYSKNDEKYIKITNEMLKKIIQLFEEIDQYEIMQTALWILSNYTTNIEQLSKIFDLIMKSIGDLNLELSGEDEISLNKKDEENPSNQEKKTITKTVILPDGSYGTVTKLVDVKEIKKNIENKFLRKFILESNFYFSSILVSSITNIIFKMKKFEDFEKFKIYYYNALNIICAILKLNSKLIYKDPDNENHIQICLKFLLSENGTIYEEWNEYMKKYQEEFNKEREKYINNLNNNLSDNNLNGQSIQSQTNLIRANADDVVIFRHCKMYDPDNYDVAEEEEQKYLNANNMNINGGLLSEFDSENNDASQKNKKFIEVLSGTEDPLFVEATVTIYTFDLSIDFSITNKTKNSLQSCSIQLFVPKEFTVIEKSGTFNLNSGENITIRNSVKFSKTVNAYIFGQISYSNYKGENFFLNLSGIFLELMNNYRANISDIDFRKNWNDYSWEHNVMLVSRKQTFKECIQELMNGLKLTLVFPKTIDDIDDNAPFLVCNLYSKTKLEEDALINVSVEKTKDKKIIGTCVIRSKTKDFMTSLGEKIKTLIS